MLRTITSLLFGAVIISGFTAVAQTDLTAACTASEFDLDCTCVNREFEMLSAGTSADGKSALADISMSILGSDRQDALANMNPMVMMEIAERLDPVMQLIEACPAKAAPNADDIYQTVVSTVTSQCKASAYALDCGCVGTQLQSALPLTTNAGPKLLEDFMLGAMERPHDDNIADTSLVQNSAAIEALGDFRSTCAIPSEPGLTAARNISGQAQRDTSLQARANAEPREHILLDCLSFGGPPEMCACRIAMMEEDLGDDLFTYKGILGIESVREELGLNDDFIQSTADRTGMTRRDADDKRARSNATINAGNERIGYACAANMKALGIQP